MSARAVLLGVLAVCAAGAAAILLNLLLLGNASARNDPIGRLSPRTQLPSAPQQLPAAPPWTIRPAHGHVSDEGADD
ncbi:MAG TPA: hypothetical protein VF327_08775 [Gaiellaceae bacterium]